VTSTKRTPQFKILIVDDHPMMREGLAARITAQPDLATCGEACDINDALAQFKASQPDLIIVDLSLKTGHGLDLIKEIRARDEKVKILVVTAFDESLYAERSLRAGAQGFINKQELQESILDAIRTVLDGRRYLSDTMTQRLVARAVGGKDSNAHGDPVERLSDRELEVFTLIGRGKTTSAIANQLHLSVHTIDSHREKIRHKLNLKNGAELTQRAVQWVLESGWSRHSK
jgi:DNA-binding NarL/FixJ family response regulator